MEPVYTYRATSDRVIDGDTFVANVDLGFFVAIKIHVRLHGVDTPEKGQAGWAEATDALKALITDKSLILKSFKDQRTFERWVCDVWVGDLNVSDAQQIHGK